MGALISLVLLAPGQDPQVPVRDAELRVFDTATGELTAEVKARELRADDRELVGLIRPAAVLFTRDSEQKPKKVFVEADRGTYHKEKQILTLEGAVSATTPAGEWFRSETAVIALKEKTLTTDRDFTAGRPGVHLSGTGLRANTALDRHEILGRAAAEFQGELSKTLKDGASSDPAVRTRMESTGPCKVRSDPTLVVVETQAPATLRRTDAKGWVTARADRTRITATRSGDAYTIDRSDLEGAVTIEDSDRRRLEGRALLWDAASQRMDVTDGSMHGPDQELTATQIRFHRNEPRVEARDQVRARVTREGEPMDLSTDRFDAAFEERDGRQELSRLHADGRTRVSQGKTTILCGRFDYDAPADRATIVGRPMACVRQDEIEAFAPLFSRRKDELVVGGPKLIRFRDGTKPAAATCGGDLTLTGSRIRLTGGAWLATEDFRLRSDEAEVELTEDRKLKSFRATGGVCVTATEEGEPVTATAAEARRAGDTDLLVLTGRPLAVLSAEKRRVQANVLTFDRTRHTFSATGTDRPVKIVYRR